MIKLIHHQSSDDRPFRTQLDKLRKQGVLWLAAPYVSIDVLAEYRPERLITDVTEWLGSEPDHRGCLAFVEANPGVVRHRAKLHAKVMIGKTAMLFGSANPTRRGLDTNEEFGAYVSTESLVEGAREWFEIVWAVSSPVDPRDLARAIEEWRKVGGPIRPTKPRFIGRVLAEEPTEEHRARFLRHLARFPSQRVAQSYLSLVAEMLAHLDLGVGDPRLSTSVPQSSRESLLPVNVGGRRVIGYRHEPAGEVGIIFPADQAQDVRENDAVAFIGGFQQRSINDLGASFVRLNSLESLTNKRLSWRSQWMEAVKAQVEQGHRATSKSHNPAYLQALMDEGYRKSALRSAFRTRSV